MRAPPLSVSSLLKHPLLLALPLYVVLLSFSEVSDLRLWIMEPVALANSGVDQDDLTDEEKLAQENLNLKAQAAALATENEFYRQTLSQLSDYSMAFGDAAQAPIPARIILRGDASNSRHSIYINRGADHGVQAGYPICVGRTLIGQVKACTAHSSLVVLISDPASVVPVCILPEKPVEQVTLDASERATRGLLRGNASDQPHMPMLRVENVDLASGVEEGMLVVTNDSAGEFPIGLLVGHVEQINNRQAFLEVDVERAADIALIDIVLVVPHKRPTLNALAHMLSEGQHLDIEAVVEK